MSVRREMYRQFYWLQFWNEWKWERKNDCW